jgi:hypothetical protein
LLIETHPLTVAQFIDPASAVFDVHENVVAASVRPDKAEATVGVKKFHGSGSHACPLRELRRFALRLARRTPHVVAAAKKKLPSPAAQRSWPLRFQDFQIRHQGITTILSGESR